MNFKEIIRLLAEYHSFLFEAVEFVGSKKENMFPSPYGVSFILIQLCGLTIIKAK